MRNPKDHTTINITKVLRDRLRDMRKGPDTYESILWRLIENYEKTQFEGTGIPQFIDRRRLEG